MKIIYIFRQYAVPPSMPSGTRHYNMARCMVSNGHKPYIFASSFQHVLKKHVREFPGFWMIEQIDGVNFVWIKTAPAYYGNDLNRLLNMIDYSIKCYRATAELKKTGIAPDIIIGSVAHLFAVLSAHTTAWRQKARFWIDIGDVWPEAYIESGALPKNHPLVIFFRHLADFLYKKAEVIGVLTPKTKEYLVSLGVSADKIILTMPGIMDEDSVEQPVDVPTQERPFTVIYAGALGPLYPICEMVTAAAALEKAGLEFRIEIYGDGTDRNKIANAIMDAGVKNVRLNEPVPKSELQKIYLSADALILLEKNVAFGFPNKLLDYMQARKPVIVASECDYGLPDDLFTKIHPVNQEIEAALRSLISVDPAKRQEQGRAIHAYASENFNMRKTYNRVMEPLVSGGRP